MTVCVEHGDCLDVMARLAAEGVTVDAIVTDPPYGLGFMGKHWDAPENVAFRPETWRLAFDLMKPGAHIVAFSGTRTYHRMACAIEDAGLEIRDQLAWVYGSGFPKSHDISKAIDKAAGVERETLHVVNRTGKEAGCLGAFAGPSPITAPATEAARQWQGWGTALKPSWEPIVLARKPLIGTVAANVLAHGTGGLNIDACRVEALDGVPAFSKDNLRPGTSFDVGSNRTGETTGKGRWPANLAHDGSPEVLAGFPETASGGYPPEGGQRSQVAVYGTPNERGPQLFKGSEGSAARFFYTAKADAADRLGSKHPTVKPVDLMAWLCRLITPPGGLILDPFAGSGTTGMAAMREGFDAILIEREAEYVADIRRRLAHVKGEDAPLFASADASGSPPPAKAVPSTGCSRTNNRADGTEEVNA